MSYSSSIKLAAVLVVGAVGLLGTSAVAEVVINGGITPQNLANVPFNDDALVNHDRVKFQTKDPTDVRLQKLTFAAGSRSGWHHHPGLLIVAVQSGTVTLSDRNCASKTYGPGMANGAVFIEGDDDTVQATSAGGAVAYVTIIVPRGAPSRVEDQVPFCARSF